MPAAWPPTIRVASLRSPQPVNTKKTQIERRYHSVISDNYVTRDQRLRLNEYREFTL